ncbi:MAG: NADH-quinone oxidoreductase subunit NuoB [Dehalococcoidia bacterium]
MEIVRPEVNTPQEADAAEGQAINELIAESTSPIPDPGKWIDEVVDRNIFLTTADTILAWGRQRSIFPMLFATACCGMEVISMSVSRFDLSRFGMDVVRFSPRQADVMIIAGTITWKMALATRLIYDQMAEPKWVVAMGACAISGGTFRESYSVTPGVNRIMPVDVYIPGCPPKPEAVIFGINRLHAKIIKGTMDNPMLSKQ